MLGTVHIIAGPTVPIVSFGCATCKRSRATLAGGDVSRQQQRQHRHPGAHLSLRQKRPSRRDDTRDSATHCWRCACRGFTVYGPKTNLFIDRSGCQVDQP